MIYDIYENLIDLISSWKILMFTPDRSVKRRWFAEYSISMYGGKNSLDIQETNLQNGQYDLIIANHVLEHVADTRKAILESLRVVGPNGIMHVTIPTPVTAWNTVDWGFPDPKLGGHYRNYGADFPVFFRENIPGAHIISIVWRDPVLQTHDILYMMSQSIEKLQEIARPLQAKSIPVIRYS